MPDVANLDVRIGADISELQKKLAKASQAIKTAGGNLKKAGRNLSQAVTLPLVAIGAVGVKAAADVSGSQKKLQASLGLTADEAKNLQSVVTKVWKQGFGANMDEVNGAVSKVKQNMNDLSNTELIGVTKGALTLSQVFGADVNDSTKAASTLMKNFGLDGRTAMDLITVGFQKGGDYSGELLDTMNEYAPQFAAMGLNAKDMTNILIQGAQNGAFSLDKVGDAVKEFSIRAVDGSKTTKQGFQMIGLNAQKMGEKIAQGGPKAKHAFAVTVAALASMKDPLKQQQAGVALFGTQWEDVKKNVILAMDTTKSKLGQVKGATKKTGQVMQSSFGAKLQQTWRKLQAALKPVGTIILKLANQWLPKVSTAIQNVTKWFNNLSPHMQNFIVIGGLIVAALGPFLFILGALVTAIGALLTPIGAIVVGIGLFIGAFVVAYAKIKWFRDAVNTAFQFIKQFIMQILGVIVTFVKQELTVIQKWWSKHGKAIMKIVKALFDFLKPIFKIAFALFKSIVMGTLKSIIGIIKGAVNIILGVIGFFVDLLTGNWDQLWADVKQIFRGAIQFVWNYIKLILLGKIIGVFGRFIGKGVGLIGRFVGKIISWFKSLGSKIRGAVSRAFNWIKSKIYNIVTGIARKIGSWSTDMGLKFLRMVDGIKSAVSNIWHILTSPFRRAWNFIKSIPRKIMNIFKKIKIPTPHIPKISFDVGHRKIGPVSIPYPIIHWNAQGGIMTRPTMFAPGQGGGEAGPEAIMPLSGRYMKPFADAVASQMGGQRINIQLFLDGDELSGTLMDRVMDEVRLRTGMK